MPEGDAQMTATLTLVRALLGGLLSRVFALLKWLFDHPWQAACAALALWTAWLMIITMPAQNAALIKVSAQLQAEETAHARTKTNYASAQLLAQHLARQQRTNFERRYKELSTNADIQFAAGQASALAAADRYIAGNRVPNSAGAAIAGSPSGHAAAASPDRSAGSYDGPGGGPQLVAVSEADIRICTVNTARLIEGRYWALDLAAASSTLMESAGE